ncbi:MAG: hypothetical protein H7062_20085 [Candidatus Saccharimonas sp.]|nr:hypothetical protein [Planctomycetaceae bacterium]
MNRLPILLLFVFWMATRCDLRITWGQHQSDRADAAADKFVVIPVEP